MLRCARENRGIRGKNDSAGLSALGEKKGAEETGEKGWKGDDEESSVREARPPLSHLRPSRFAVAPPLPPNLFRVFPMFLQMFFFG